MVPEFLKALSSSDFFPELKLTSHSPIRLGTQQPVHHRGTTEMSPETIVAIIGVAVALPSSVVVIVACFQCRKTVRFVSAYWLLIGNQAS
jgi:hypothetical protein